MNTGDKDWGWSETCEDDSQDFVLKLEDGFRYDPKVEKEVAQEWRRRAGRDIHGLSTVLSGGVQPSYEISSTLSIGKTQQEFTGTKCILPSSKFDESNSEEGGDPDSSKQDEIAHEVCDICASEETETGAFDEIDERSPETSTVFKNMKRKLDHRIQLQFLRKPKYVAEHLKQKARQKFLKIINCDAEELKAFNEWRNRERACRLPDRVDFKKEEEKEFMYRYVELLFTVPDSFLFELDFAVKPMEKPSGQIIEDMKEKTRQIFSKITGRNEKEETKFEEFVGWKRKEDNKEFLQQYMELLTMVPSSVPTYLLKTNIERRWDYIEAVNTNWEDFDYGKTKREMQKSVYKMRTKLLGENHFLLNKWMHFPVYGTNMYGERTLWPPDQEDPLQPEFSYEDFLKGIENEALKKKNCESLNPCGSNIPCLRTKANILDELEISYCLQNLCEDLQLDKSLNEQKTDTCSVDSFKEEDVIRWQYDIREHDKNCVTYLESHFAHLFREACNALYEARPADPIQYFANYLLRNHPSGKLSQSYLLELEKQYFSSEDVSDDKDEVEMLLSDDCIRSKMEGNEVVFESSQQALEQKIIADQKRIAKEIGYPHSEGLSLPIEDIIQDCIKVLSDIIDICVEVVPIQVKLQKEKKENQTSKLLEILQVSNSFEKKLIESLGGVYAVKRLVRNMLFTVAFVKTESSGTIITKVKSDFECKSTCIMHVLKTVIGSRQTVEDGRDDPSSSYFSQAAKPVGKISMDQEGEKEHSCIENISIARLKTRNELAYYLLKRKKWEDLPSEKLSLHSKSSCDVFLNQGESSYPWEDDTYSPWDISKLSDSLWEEDVLPDDLWNEYIQGGASGFEMDSVRLSNGTSDENDEDQKEESDSAKSRGPIVRAGRKSARNRDTFDAKNEIAETKSASGNSDSDYDFEELDEKVEVKAVTDSHDVKKDIKFVVRNVLFTIAYVFDMKVKAMPADSLEKRTKDVVSYGKEEKTLKKFSAIFEKPSMPKELSRILSLVPEAEKDSYKSLVDSYIRAFEAVISNNDVNDILRAVHYLKKNELPFSEQRRNEINRRFVKVAFENKVLPLFYPLLTRRLGALEDEIRRNIRRVHRAADAEKDRMLALYPETLQRVINDAIVRSRHETTKQFEDLYGQVFAAENFSRKVIVESNLKLFPLQKSEIVGLVENVVTAVELLISQDVFNLLNEAITVWVECCIFGESSCNNDKSDDSAKYKKEGSEISEIETHNVEINTIEENDDKKEAEGVDTENNIKEQFEGMEDEKEVELDREISVLVDNMTSFIFSLDDVLHCYQLKISVLELYAGMKVHENVVNIIEHVVDIVVFLVDNSDQLMLEAYQTLDINEQSNKEHEMNLLEKSIMPNLDVNTEDLLLWFRGADEDIFQIQEAHAMQGMLIEVGEGEVVGCLVENMILAIEKMIGLEEKPVLRMIEPVVEKMMDVMISTVEKCYILESKRLDAVLFEEFFQSIVREIETDKEIDQISMVLEDMLQAVEREIFVEQALCVLNADFITPFEFAEREKRVVSYYEDEAPKEASQFRLLDRKLEGDVQVTVESMILAVISFQEKKYITTDAGDSNVERLLESMVRTVTLQDLIFETQKGVELNQLMGIYFELISALNVASIYDSYKVLENALWDVVKPVAIKDLVSTCSDMKYYDYGFISASPFSDEFESHIKGSLYFYHFHYLDINEIISLVVEHVKQAVAMGTVRINCNVEERLVCEQIVEMEERNLSHVSSYAGTHRLLQYYQELNNAEKEQRKNNFIKMKFQDAKITNEVRSLISIMMHVVEEVTESAKSGWKMDEVVGSKQEEDENLIGKLVAIICNTVASISDWKEEGYSDVLFAVYFNLSENKAASRSRSKQQSSVEVILENVVHVVDGAIEWSKNTDVIFILYSQMVENSTIWENRKRDSTDIVPEKNLQAVDKGKNITPSRAQDSKAGSERPVRTLGRNIFKGQHKSFELLFNAYYDIAFTEEAKKLIDSIYLVIEELAEIVITPKPERLFQIYREEVESEDCSKKVQRNMMCYEIDMPEKLLTIYRTMTEEYDVQTVMKYIVTALEEDSFRNSRPHSESVNVVDIYDSLVKSGTVQTLEEVVADMIGCVEAVISFSSVDLLVAKYHSLCIERHLQEQLNEVRPVLDFVISSIQRGEIVPLIKDTIAYTQAILIGVSDTVELLLASVEKDCLSEIRERNNAFFQHFKETDAFVHDVQVLVKVLIHTVKRANREVVYPHELLAKSPQEKNKLFKMYVEKFRSKDPKFFSGKEPRKMFQKHLKTLHDDFHNNLLSLFSEEADKISIRGEGNGFEEVENVVRYMTMTIERNQESDVIEMSLEHVLDVVNVYETLIHVVEMVLSNNFGGNVQNGSSIPGDLSRSMLPLYREKKYFDQIFMPLTTIYEAAVLDMKKINEILVTADELRLEEIISASKAVLSNLVQAVVNIYMSENTQYEGDEKKLSAEEEQRNFYVIQNYPDINKVLDINSEKDYDYSEVLSVMKNETDEITIENVINNLLLVIHIADSSPYAFEDEGSSMNFWLSKKKEAYFSAYNKAKEFEQKFMAFTYSIEECTRRQHALMSSYQSFDTIKSLATCLLSVEKAFLGKGISLYNETKSKIDEHHSVNVVLEALIYVVEYDVERVLLIPMHDKVEKLMGNMFHCVTHLDLMHQNSTAEKFMTVYKNTCQALGENVEENGETLENDAFTTEVISDDENRSVFSEEERVVANTASAAVLTVDKITSLESEKELKNMFNTYRVAQDVEKVIEMVIHAAERKELDESAKNSQVMLLDFLKLEMEEFELRENVGKTVTEVINAMVQVTEKVEIEEEIKTESSNEEEGFLFCSYLQLQPVDVDVVGSVVGSVISSALWFNKEMLLKVAALSYASEKVSRETFSMLEGGKKKKISLETIMTINKMGCYKLQEELMVDRYCVESTVQHMLYIVDNSSAEDDKKNFELMACHYSVLSKFVKPEFKEMAVNYIPNLQKWKKLAFMQDIKSVISDLLETLDIVIVLEKDKVLKVFSSYQKGCSSRVANEAEMAAERVIGSMLSTVAGTKTRTNVSKYRRKGQTLKKEEKNKKQSANQKGEYSVAGLENESGVENGEDLRKKVEMQGRAKELLILYQKDAKKKASDAEIKSVARNVLENLVYIVSSNCEIYEWERDERDGLVHVYENSSVEIDDPYIAMLLFRMAVNWVLEWIVDSESQGVIFSACSRFWFKIWCLFHGDDWIPDETEMYCACLLQRMIHAVLKGPNPSRLLEQYLLIDTVIETCKEIVTAVDEEFTKEQEEDAYKAFVIYKEVSAFEEEFIEHQSVSKTTVRNMISAINVYNEDEIAGSSSKILSSYFKMQKIDCHISGIMLQNFECSSVENIQAALNCMLLSVERIFMADGKQMQQKGKKSGRGVEKSAKIEKSGDPKPKFTSDKQTLTIYQEYAAIEKLLLSMVFTIDIIATTSASNLLFFYKKHKIIHRAVFEIIGDAEKLFMKNKVTRKKRVESLKKEASKSELLSCCQDVVQCLFEIVACVEDLLVKVDEKEIDAEESDIDADMGEVAASVKSVTSAVEDLADMDEKMDESAVEELEASDEKGGTSEVVQSDEDIIAAYHTFSESIAGEADGVCAPLIDDMCEAIEKTLIEEKEDKTALFGLNELISDQSISMTFSINWHRVIRHYNKVLVDELIARNRRCVEDVIKVMISTVQNVVEGQTVDVASLKEEGIDRKESPEEKATIKGESLSDVLFARHAEVMESRISDQYEKVFKDKGISFEGKVSEAPKVIHSVKLYEVPQNLQERKIMQKKLKEIQLKRKELLEKSKQMGMDNVMQYLKQREEMTDKKLNLNKRKWKRRKLLKSNKMEQEERFWWLSDKKRTCNKNFLVEQVIDSWNSCNPSIWFNGDIKQDLGQETGKEVDSQGESKQHSLSQTPKHKSADFFSDFDVFLEVPSNYDEKTFFSSKDERKIGSVEKEPADEKDLKPAPSVRSVEESRERLVKDERVKEAVAVPLLQAEERKEHIEKEGVAEGKDISADVVPQRSAALSAGVPGILKSTTGEIPEYFEQNENEGLKTHVLERKPLKEIDFLQTKWNNRDMGVIARNSVFKYAPDLKDLHEYCYSYHTLLQRDYCRETIGDIVRRAMEAINQQKPSDPVAYLAWFCLKNKYKFSTSSN